VSLDLVVPVVEAEREVVADHSLLGFREQTLEIGAFRQHAMSINALFWGVSEALIPEGDELLLEETIRFLHGGEPAHPHLFDQPVL
jgi:hypothetical protein